MGLIAALQSDGWTIVVCAPNDRDSEAQLARLGIRFVPMPIDAKGLSSIADLRTFLAYRDIMRTVRPDAFLGWTIKPNIYGGLAARSLGIPAIANISGLGTAFIRDNMLTKVVSGLYRFGLARARTVFFQNATDRDLFVERSMVRERQTCLLPGSGIDLARFATAEPDLREKGHFLMIARLLGDKGVREFVAAARLLKARGLRARFGLLGFLDVANRTAITRSEVDAWVAEGLIDYHPPVEDVRAMIATADAVVLPSYREGTSRVLLEACALARPVIATDVPGCREIVDDGVNGFLCAARDPVSLAAAMEKLLKLDDGQWIAMASAARLKVEAEFAEQRVFDAYRVALADMAPTH
nr:glycosyltransferase family 4 protein [Sphingorhabdus soli]